MANEQSLDDVHTKNTCFQCYYIIILPEDENADVPYFLVVKITRGLKKHVLISWLIKSSLITEFKNNIGDVVHNQKKIMLES